MKKLYQVNQALQVTVRKFLFVLFLAIHINLFSQQVNIPGIYQGDTEAADYDNDGDFDIMVAGNINDSTKQTALYINNNGTFTKLAYNFIDVNWSSIDWGDYNGDGYLDLLITGQDSVGAARIAIYKNNQIGSFEIINTSKLQGVIEGAALWGDYDNDGDLDIFLTGQVTSSSSIAYVYKNNSNDDFTIVQSFDGLDEGFASFTDFDNDGDLDIFYNGKEDNQTNYTRSFLYENNRGSFKYKSNIDFGWDGSVDWQDYDDDGDLDAILTGWSGGYIAQSFVYKNNGGLSFARKNYASLKGIDYGNAKWGDFNYDGLSDLIICGRDITYNGVWKIYPFTALYTYDTMGDSFTDLYYPFDSLSFSSAQWIEYTNDSTSSILISGKKLNSTTTNIYTNLWPLKNSPPISVNQIWDTINANTARFNWTRAIDYDNPEQSLSYNMFVYNVGRNRYLMSPMADTLTGKRNLAKIGNVCLDTSWVLYGFESGFYTWGVQAIDKSFAGGKFSNEKGFYVSSSFNKITYNIKDSIVYGTTPYMQYQFNNGEWHSCEFDSTCKVSFQPGVFRLRDKYKYDNLFIDTLVRTQAQGFTIDYYKEEISLSDNEIEVSNDSLFSNILPVSSGIIKVTPGDSIYIRCPATIDSLSSEVKKLLLPNRPKAPIATYLPDIDELDWNYDTVAPEPYDYFYLFYIGSGEVFYSFCEKKPEDLLDSPGFYLTETDNPIEKIEFFINSSNSLKRFKGDVTTINVIAGGIEIKHNKDFEVEIYPNPVKNDLHISGISNIELIKIIDISGKCVLEVSNPEFESGIDISKLDQGIYTVKLWANSSVFLKKIIKN